MFGYLTFDPSSMSDEELLSKQQELQGKVVWASRFGSGDMVEGLQRIIAAIDAERFERYSRIVWAEQQALWPTVIETEPDLQQKNDQDSKPDKKIVPQSRPRISVTRSARPSNDGEP